MELLHRIFYTAVGALSVVYFVVKVSLGYWKRRGILHEKPKFLWGNLKGVASGKKHVQEALQTIYESYKGRGAPFIGFYAFLKPFVLVLDLDLVRHILVTDSGHFTTRGLYQNVGEEPLSGNLLQMDGHKWRQLHAQARGVFTTSNLEKLLPQLSQICRSYQSNLLANSDQGKPWNISELVDNFNTEVISTLVFGLSGKSSLPEFQEMTRNYWNNFKLWKGYLALEYPTLARLLKYKSFEEVSSEYFQKLTIQQLKQSPRNGEENFLQLFAKETTLNDLQIAAQAFGFILAGLEPLNATLAFCLYELALQPELQEKVRQEINDILQESKGQLIREDLLKFKLTKKVIKETLRLHSPYPCLLRRATKSFEVPKSVFMIAKGNNVLIPTVAIHRDPSLYPEPQRFDPERFELAAVRSRPEISFLPYGDGLRGCLAAHFAETQMVVGLVALLQHHRFAPCAETLIPMRYDNRKLLLKPKKDIYLSVERLKAA